MEGSELVFDRRSPAVELASLKLLLGVGGAVMSWVSTAPSPQPGAKWVSLDQLRPRVAPFFSDILWPSCTASHIFEYLSLQVI